MTLISLTPKPSHSSLLLRKCSPHLLIFSGQQDKLLQEQFFFFGIPARQGPCLSRLMSFQISALFRKFRGCDFPHSFKQISNGLGNCWGQTIYWDITLYFVLHIFWLLIPKSSQTIVLCVLIGVSDIKSGTELLPEPLSCLLWKSQHCSPTLMFSPKTKASFFWRVASLFKAALTNYW